MPQQNRIDHDLLYQGEGESRHAFAYWQSGTLRGKMTCRTKQMTMGDGEQIPVSFIEEYDTCGKFLPRVASSIFACLGAEVGKNFVWDRRVLNEEERELLRVVGHPYLENYTIALLEKVYDLRGNIAAAEEDNGLEKEAHEAYLGNLIAELKGLHQRLFKVVPILLYRVRPWLFRDAKPWLQYALDGFREIKDLRDYATVSSLDALEEEVPLFTDQNIRLLHASFDQAEQELTAALS